MVKQKQDIAYGINRGNPKIFLLALATAIIFIYIIMTTILGIIALETIHIVPRIIITLVCLEFLWRKIIEPISKKMLGIMQNMTTGKSIKESIIEEIPKEYEENENKNKKKKL